jgi:hypothetical protein
MGIEPETDETTLLIPCSKAGHEPARCRLGPSRTSARSFSARLGLARVAVELEKWARPELCTSSVQLGVARESSRQRSLPCGSPFSSSGSGGAERCARRRWYAGEDQQPARAVREERGHDERRCVVVGVRLRLRRPGRGRRRRWRPGGGCLDGELK